MIKNSSNTIAINSIYFVCVANTFINNLWDIRLKYSVLREEIQNHFM